jgi:hypothetical protein
MKNNFDQIFGNPQRNGSFMVVVNSLLIFSAGYFVCRILMNPANNSNSYRNKQLLEVEKAKGDVGLVDIETMRKVVNEEVIKSIDDAKKRISENVDSTDFKQGKVVDKDV